MANISKEIQAFKTAVYGEDVRDGMISLAEKVNSEVESNTQKVNQYGQAEVGRVQAELQREREFSTLKTESEDATKAANNAASSADSAASNANSKASLANTAARNANTATTAANNAAQEANTAVENANAAIENAESATKDAAIAAGNATSAASSANIAADRASEAAEKAEGVAIDDISAFTVTFQQAMERANIQSGDTLAVAFGKLAKYCTDFDEHAFLAPMQNLTTTDTGFALDATMGKRLNDDLSAEIDVLRSDLTSKQNNLTRNILTGNMNDARVPGSYWCDFKNVTESPYTDGFGWCNIFKNSASAFTQTIYRYNQSGITQIAVRGYTNAQWYPWRVINTIAIS